jgi:hypothetical protein
MWQIWRQIHPFSPPVSVTVSAYFCCKTRIYMACRTRLLLERICHPIRYSVAICLRICLIRPKGPFISQGLLDIVSAYVSAFSSRICLRICHLPRTTGRTLSYLPSYLSICLSVYNTYQTLFFIIALTDGTTILNLNGCSFIFILRINYLLVLIAFMFRQV